MDGSTGRRHDALALDKALSEPWDLLWDSGTVEHTRDRHPRQTCSTPDVLL